MFFLTTGLDSDETSVLGILGADVPACVTCLSHLGDSLQLADWGILHEGDGMWLLITSACFWVLCGVGAYRLVTRTERPTPWNAMLILVQGPIGLVALLLVACRRNDDE